MRYRNPLAPCTARARRSGVVVGASSRINASGLACTIASSSGSVPAGKSVSRSPDTPAAAASRTKRSSPKAMSGFKYVITTTGISSAARRIWSSTRGTVMPWSSAAWVERWMVGPSASGSENGTPTSTKSAPAAVLHPAFGRGHDADDRSMHMGDVRIGAVHERHLVRVEDDARAHGVDPDQVDERLHHDLIVAAPRVLPHFLEHLIRLDRHRLVDAPARGRVEPIGYRDDLRVNGQLARPQRFGVTGEVGLHVVLVGDDHAPIGDLAVAAQPEQGEHTEPGVRLHDAPLFIAQAPLLVQHLQRHA